MRVRSMKFFTPVAASSTPRIRHGMSANCVLHLGEPARAGNRRGQLGAIEVIDEAARLDELGFGQGRAGNHQARPEIEDLRTAIGLVGDGGAELEGRFAHANLIADLEAEALDQRRFRHRAVTALLHPSAALRRAACRGRAAPCRRADR